MNVSRKIRTRSAKRVMLVSANDLAILHSIRFALCQTSSTSTLILAIHLLPLPVLLRGASYYYLTPSLLHPHKGSHATFHA